MPAAKVSPGKAEARIYMDAAAWEALLVYKVGKNVSASAIVAALVEDFIAASPAEQAATLERARAITLGRRRRAEG